MTAGGRIVALIMAAGSGSRAGDRLPKQYRTIGGKAVLAHAVDRLRSSGVEDVQVVIGEGQDALYERALAGRSLPAPVPGAATRQASVRRGLERLADQGGIATVLIHDAARPFVSAPVIGRLLGALDEADGVVPALSVADSIARGGERLGGPVRRDDLVRVQTPQAFDFSAILAAHRRWSGGADATDDAQVARAAGIEVAIVAGDPALEKLTFDTDFERAESLLRATMISRTGSGFDVHGFCAGDHLSLGGVRIAHDRGLAGHSDADVALHALTDALLGAIGAGDIGDHFPPGDPQWRGAASAAFVERARILVEARGGLIDHVDLTIICEQPRIAPHKDAMRQAIAALLRLPMTRISVKATTTEGLGFAGRREGIAAQAVATVRLPEDQ